MSTPTAKPRVFVFLHYGFGLARWQRRRAQGEALSATPYGYHYADESFDLTYSIDHAEGVMQSLLRRMLFKVLGFNLLHAWRNRRAIFAANIIWTHTEHEHLAVALLLRLTGRHKKPLLLAQSIWLADGWQKFPAWKRSLYRWLLLRADMLTVLSALNRQFVQSLLPGKPVEQVFFGVDLDVFSCMPVRSAAISGRPLRVLAIGNDRHRDWDTLKAALADLAGVEVRIITPCLREDFTAGLDNIKVRPQHSPSDVVDAYAWADLVIVPLKPNLHVSGITVTLEATTRGLPVVCSDTGGLRDYFSADHIGYVPVNDPIAMRAAVLSVAHNYAGYAARVSKAQQRLLEADITAQGFVRQHVMLTERMLANARLSLETALEKPGHASRHPAA